MLFGNVNKPGPGVSENAPRRKGLMRYFELLGRDFGNYWRAGFLAMLCFFPMAACILIAILTGSILPALIGGLVGGAISGPCMVGLFDTVVRTLRDEPGYWWHTYKMAVKRSAKASLVPGAIGGVCLSSAVLLVYSLLTTGSHQVLPWIVTMLSLLLILGALPYLWMQIALFDLTPGQLIRNTFSLWLAFFPRTLLAILFQLAYWALIILFMPYTEIALLLTSLWLPVSAACLAVYKPFEKTFKVEESVRKAHETQRAETETAPANR